MTTVIDQVIAGAIYDFAASLTTNSQSLTVGAGHNASPVADRVKEFLDKRGVLGDQDLVPPLVNNWTNFLQSGPDQPKTSMAFSIIKSTMQKDYGYAWGWHCNVAMASYDAMRKQNPHMHNELAHQVSNDAAARFMRICFDVDTTLEPGSKG